MTVEAAMVLPLFLLFFLTLGSSLEMMRFHARVEAALWEVGRESCVYGTAVKETSWLKETGGAAGELTEEVAELILSNFYVSQRIRDYLGEECLASVPIRQGEKGLGILVTLPEDQDVIDVSVTYVAEPKWATLGFHSFLMRNHYLGRIWTGFELKEQEQSIFYLAENAQVYHRDVNCSHLKLNPKLTPGAELEKAVNEKGEHYRKCSLCAKETMPEQIWIAPEGECYHYQRDCPGLKRTVRVVTWKEAGKYRPCSRCGA